MLDSSLIYGDLTYQLNAVFFTVHNELGRYCSEKQYADRIAQELRNRNIPFQREYVLPPLFEGEQPGRHRVDFLIADVVVVECKVKRMLERSDYDQVLRYLGVLNCKLGMLVNFRQRTLTPRRVLNSSAPIHVSAYPHHLHDKSVSSVS